MPQPDPGRRPRSPLRSRAALAAVAAAAAAMTALTVLAAGGAAAGPTSKPFSGFIATGPGGVPGDTTSASAPAGSVATVSIRLRDDTIQSLGSANITIPSGIVLQPGAPVTQSPATPGSPTVAGNTIQLRNLNLAQNASATVTFQARIPCSSAAQGYASTWLVQVKQSNDFNGTGNDLYQRTSPMTLSGTGSCSLAFASGGQPASAQRSSNITADAYLPTSANAVTVNVLDGSGTANVSWWSQPVAIAIDSASNPGSTTLAGTTSATPVDGVASFLANGVGPSIPVSADGYRLKATSTGIPAATSQPPTDVSASFDIDDVGQRCKANQTCSGQTSKNGVTAAVSGTATSDQDLLLLSLDSATKPTFDCAGYSATTPTLDFDLQTSAPSGNAKTVTLTISNPTKPASKYELCFRSLAPFTAQSLAPAPKQTDGSYVALLPACLKVLGTPPCLADRGKVGSSVVLTAKAPAGDPWIKG